MHRLRLLLALAGVAAAAACGGGDEPAGNDPAAWADEVCSAVASWVDDLQTSSQGLVGSITDPTDLEGVRDQLVDFLGDAVSRTDDLVSAVDAAGAPAVDEGEAIGADVRAAIAGVRDLFAGAQADAEALPTDDPLAFASAAQELGASIQVGAEEAGGTFDELGARYDAPELEEALAANEDCSGLSG